MLKRIRIQGYKSLEDVEVSLSQLVVLFGPNAAGKSNLLDALQLLSKLGTSRDAEGGIRSTLSRQAARVLYHWTQRHQGSARTREVVVLD